MNSGVRRQLRVAIGAVAALLLWTAAMHAQQIWAGGYGNFTPPKYPTKDTFTGSFTFCRALFGSNRREKSGWRTDYPGADINFSIRLSELTKADVKIDRGGPEGDEPDPVVVRLTDDALFQCPFILMEDAGTMHLRDDEVERLREYLLKGGFILSSDYHGTWAKQQFDDEMGRVLPHGEFPIVDMAPPDHPMWNMLFPVKQLAQMASIQTWRRTGGTIERWNDDRGPATARGIGDRKGRIVVLMLHDTDVPDGWEREGEDPEYFFRFSPDAYSVGIDAVLYAMTH